MFYDAVQLAMLAFFQIGRAPPPLMPLGYPDHEHISRYWQK